MTDNDRAQIEKLCELVRGVKAKRRKTNERKIRTGCVILGFPLHCVFTLLP